MTVEDYRRAIEMEPVTRETLSTRRELSTSEILALMDKCQKNKNDVEGTRDAAIIGIMYAAGLRRIEVAGLTVDSYNPEVGKLIFTGKWDKQESAYITNGAAEALNTWISIRGNEPGALFVEVSTGEKVLTQREELIVERFSQLSGAKAPHKKPGQKIYRTSKVFSFLLNCLLAAVYIVFGVFSNKRYAWAFIIGLVFYGLDGALCLIAQDWLSVAFLAFAGFSIFKGMQSAKQLDKMTV